MIVRFLAAVGVILATTGALNAAEGTARIYPPYPEVWGRELPAPAGRIVNGFFVRDAGTGDFLLIYAHRAVDPATGNLQGEGQWTRLEFFAGNAASITPDSAEALRRRYSVPKLRVRARGTNALVLANGHKVMPSSREPKGVGCWVNYAGDLRVLDEGDRMIAQKVVLRLLERPERREYWTHCEYNQSGDHYFAKVDALAMVLYPLADGTFLGEGTGSPFMIRFRADLTSPFIDAHPNLFVVDADEIDRLVRGAYYAQGAHRIQIGNDALYDYVSELKRKKAGASPSPPMGRRGSGRGG